MPLDTSKLPIIKKTNPKLDIPVIVLASGGVDSTLVMAKLLKGGRTVIPFFSNYHQDALEQERNAINSIVSHLGLSLHPGHCLRPVQEVEINVGLGTIEACPGRVLSFAGAACIWAFTEGWTKGEIAIGIHKGDKDQDSCRVGYESL